MYALLMPCVCLTWPRTVRRVESTPGLVVRCSSQLSHAACSVQWLTAPVLLAALAECMSKPPPLAAASFSLVSLTQQTFQDQATYQSTLESIVNVPLAAEIDGRIVAMPMQEGQLVQPGELLFRLDQIQQQATVDTDLAEARKDRLNAERYIFLNQQGAVSTKERDLYVTKAIASADSVRASRATLAYKDVKAPIAGMVGDIQHKLGSVVRRGETITNIVDNRRLWLQLDVPVSWPTASSSACRWSCRLLIAPPCRPRARSASSLPRSIAALKPCW